VPLPVPPPWRFGLEIGFTDINGNRDLQLFQGAFTAEHQRRDAFIFNTKLEARYGESNRTVAAQNASFRLRFDWRPRSGASPFLGFDAEYDEIRKIDLRVSGGTGVNLNLASSEAHRGVLAFGVVAEHEVRAEDVSPRELSDTRFHTRLAYSRTIRAGVVVEATGKYQPSTTTSSDYLASADGALRVALNQTLSFRTRYEWKRDSTPAPGVASKDDRTLTATLVISW
jgi:hypothetical protein